MSAVALKKITAKGTNGKPKEVAGRNYMTDYNANNRSQ
jgi:hypothetical protein